MCEKKGTLAFGEKGLHRRVVSGNVTSSLPIAQIICFSARAKGSVQLFAKFVVVSAFLFSSALVIITLPYRCRMKRCSLAEQGKRMRQRVGEGLCMSQYYTLCGAHS